MGITSGANRTALSLMARGPEGAERGRSKEEMADAEKGEMEAEDVTMAGSTMPTTMAMPAPTATGTATAMGTGIEPGNGTGAASPKV